jgi:hypothetical protein
MHTADELAPERVAAAEQAAHPGPALPLWVRELSASIDLDALGETVVSRDLAVAFPEHAQDKAFADQLRASVRANLRSLQAVLCGDRDLTEIRLDQPLAFGEVQAQLGIPQATLQKSYRVGFVVMWEAWNRELTARAAVNGVGVTEALDAAAAVSRTILRYQDHVASLVAQAHARADEALHQSRTHLRHRLVRDLLRRDAEALSPSDLLTIGYEFDTQHVAVLLPQLADGAATQLAVGLRSATGVRKSLVHPLGLSASVIWLGHRGGWPPARLAQLEQVLTTVGVAASISEVEGGLEGFRACLEQAQDVERIRAAWGPVTAPRLIRYPLVALEVLLLKDPDAARRFVRAELRSLAGGRPEDARLRQTLEASFRCGSHVGTADYLKVHEHTVRNRLQKIEEKLGHGWSERSAEVQVALRLHRLLHGGFHGAEIADGVTAR